MSWLPRWWRGAAPRAHAGWAALPGGGFVTLDLETTGLDPRRDAVVAAAVVPFVDGRPATGYVTLVNPGRPIPAASTAIHGITDAMVREAPPITAVLPRLVLACGDGVLVGHDIGFDLAVLERAQRAHGLPRLPNPTLDTRRLAGALHPEWADVTLDAVAARLGVSIPDRHTAEGDARAAGRILLALLPELVARGYRTAAEMAWLQESAVWSRLIY